MSANPTETDMEFTRMLAGVMGFWLGLVVVIGFLLVLFGDVLTVFA